MAKVKVDYKEYFAQTMESVMKRYEYRIVFLKLKTGISNEEQILEGLNTYGKEGC